MLGMIVSAMSGLVKPIAGVFAKREQTKQALAKVKANVALAKDGNATQIVMTDQEWEAIGKKTEGDTWKDEFVTVIIYSPLIALVYGGLFDDEIFGRALKIMGAINQMDMSDGYGWLMLVVTLAAIGIKAVKR